MADAPPPHMYLWYPRLGPFWPCCRFQSLLHGEDTDSWNSWTRKPFVGDIASSDATSGTAELVVLGGTILTLDRSSSRASALAARAGVITAIGDDRTIAALIGPGTTVVNLNGRAAIP